MTDGTPLVAANALLVGVSLTLGGYESFLWLKRQAGREHLWRGAVAVAAAGYAGLVGIHYLTTDPATAVLLSKLEAATILAALLILPVQISAVLEQPLPGPLLAMIVVPASLCAVLLPTDVLISDRIQPLQLRLAEQPFLQVVETPLGWGVIGLAAVCCGASLAWLWRHRARKPRAVWHVSAGLLLWIGALALEEGLRFSPAGVPMNLLEYGFVAMALSLVAYDVRWHADLLEGTQQALDQLLGVASDAIVALHPDGTVIEINQVLEELLALGPGHHLEGYPFAEIVADEDQAALARLLAEGGVATLSLIRPDGDLVAVEGVVLHPRGRPDLLLLRDVTARERATALRLEASRAEAMGTLGVAVDQGLQAPLAEVGALLRELSEALRAGPERRRVPPQLDEALSTIRDMASWIEIVQLIAVGDEAVGIVPVCLQRVVHAVVALATTGQGARFVVDVRPDLWVAGNPRDLAQALLDVLRHTTGGLPDETAPVRIEAIAGDDLVLIVVREDGAADELDTSVSIPPFPLGLDGAGLGLGACRETIRRLGGRLTVRPGDGGFEIALPRAPARPQGGSPSR